MGRDMSIVDQFGRYLGGGVAHLGLATSATFFGRRTADPLASWFFDPLTIWRQLLGVVGGLVVIAIRLAIIGQTAESSSETDE